MIHTITFNPSLDYIVRTPEMRLGKINRAAYEKILPGGKGVNVSIVLGKLGHANRALGFAAGFTGDKLEELLSEAGVSCDFQRVERGMTRINVKIKAQEETELNGMGPEITAADIDALYERIDQIEAGDTLVISGSVPSALPDDMYERIMERLEGRGVRIAVDAERDLLTRVLPYHPFLIKPNNHELGQIFGVELRTKDEVIPYARKLQEQGAANVLISMAGEGGVLIDENGEAHLSEAPKGELVNSVGAGDSMVAGFIARWIETDGDAEEAFRWGLCTGSASAFSEELATRPEVEALLERL